MIDVNLLRDDVTGVASLLKKRGFDLDTESFSKLEASRTVSYTHLTLPTNREV